MIRADAWVLTSIVVAALALAFAVPRLMPAKLRWRGAVVAPVLLLLLAAGGFVLSGGASGERILLIDVSRSTGVEAPRIAEVAVRAGLDPEGLRTWIFGRAAVPVDGSRERPGRGDIERAGPDGSNLAAALGQAASDLRAGGTITVATDGRVDVPPALAAAARLVGAGIRVEITSLGRKRRGDLRVEWIRVPSRIAPSSRATAIVSIAGDAGDGGEVRLLVDGEIVARRRIRPQDGDALSLRFDLPGLSEGFHVIEAAVVRRSPDSLPENDRAAAGLVVSSGFRRAFVVGEAPPDALGSFALLDWTAREAISGDADLIVLGNVPATEMASGGSELASFVATGGGLLVLGGDRSFGPGGYAGRPFEDCLPVLSSTGGERLAVTLLLDRSATMGEPFRGGRGTAKLHAARQAASRLLEALPADATFTLATFSREVEVLAQGLDLASPEGRRRARQAVEAIPPAGGGTALGPPLTLALNGAPANPEVRWLTILVTDGRLEAEAPERPIAVAAGLRRAGCRLAILAVGEDADLELLGRLGGERPPDVVTEGGEIGTAFLDALLESEAEGRIIRELRNVVPGAGLSPPWSGELPPVNGLVRTRGRAEAEVWFETARGEPLVAGWRYGLGRVAILSTDVPGGWAPGWEGVPLVPALAAWAARPVAAGGVRAEVSRRHGELAIELWLPVAAPTVRGLVRGEDGERREISFVPLDAGRFRATLSEMAPGGALLQIEVGGTTWSGGISIPGPDEFRASGPDDASLDRLRLGLGPTGEGRGERNVAFVPAILALGIFVGDRASRILRRRLKGRREVDR